jgi:hypothetical protein
MATNGLLQMVGTVSLGVGGCLAVSGCNLGEGFKDFGSDLSDQEMITVDGPGTKISDGQLTGMIVDPWGDDGAVVVGFRYDEDGPKLRMQPFDGRAGCDVGRAYRCIVFNRLENEPQLVAYLDDVTDGVHGTLYFANHSCQVVYGGIKDAELPGRLFDSPPGLIVPAGGKLLEVDPFRLQTRTIAENLGFWSGPGTANSTMPVWYVSDGKLVVLDQSRKPALSLGQNVTEVVFQASDPSQGLFLVDGGNLTRYEQSTGTEPKLVANDVCGVSLGGYGVSYFSPCAERTLVIRDLSSGTAFEIDSGISSLLSAQVRQAADGSGLGAEAVYTKPSTTDDGYADLWLKTLGQVPRLWQHRLGRFISATPGPGPTLIAVVDYDTTTGAGRLVRDGAEGEQTLCENVSLQYPLQTVGSGWLLLTDVVDGYGTLIWLSEGGDRQTVAEHIGASSSVKTPIVDPTYDGVKYPGYFNLQAFLTNSVDGVGTLTLLDHGNLGALLPLEGKVSDGKFDFFRNMAAISYFDQYDPVEGTGTLNVYQTHVGARSVVSKNVNEYAELVWPYEGVIYSVKEGSSYSLWSARAKP